jgi:hypothetical protein
MNEMNIFVYFDPSKIGTHFGNQSITGSVTWYTYDPKIGSILLMHSRSITWINWPFY